MQNNNSATHVVVGLISLVVPGLGQLLQMRLCRALVYFFTAFFVTVICGLLLPFLAPWLFDMGVTAFFIPTLIVGVFAACDAMSYSSAAETSQADASANEVAS